MNKYQVKGVDVSPVLPLLLNIYYISGEPFYLGGFKYTLQAVFKTFDLFFGAFLVVVFLLIHFKSLSLHNHVCTFYSMHFHHWIDKILTPQHYFSGLQKILTLALLKLQAKTTLES